MSMSAYDETRDIFLRFRQGLEQAPHVLDEMLKALGVLITEYDTSIRENRFIAGGGTERILAIAMRAVGIHARSRGLALDEEDIVVGAAQFSVKSSYAGGKQEIRLINTLGESTTLWTASTIFVLANKGIGYADPDLLPDAQIRKRDAVTLPRRALDEMHAQHPQWLLECAVPAKAQDASLRRAASEAVVADIIRRTTAGQHIFPTLSNHL